MNLIIKRNEMYHEYNYTKNKLKNYFLSIWFVFARATLRVLVCWHIVHILGTVYTNRLAQLALHNVFVLYTHRLADEGLVLVLHM